MGIVMVRGVFQRPQRHAMQRSQKLVILGKLHAKLFGNLFFGRRAIELVPQLALDLFDLPCLTAQVTWTPVTIAEAVQNGATNAELSIRLELSILSGIKFL